MNRANVALQDNKTSVLQPSSGVLQRKCACGNKTIAAGECTECAQQKHKLQRKLTVGASNDPLEKEADQVADRIMGISESRLQHQIKSEELAEPKPLVSQSLISRMFSIQPKRVSDQAYNISPTSTASIESLNGGGSPLPQPTQSFFESRFGTDFSQVRVHTGTRAAETATAINARAFTFGRNIAFGANQYLPDSRKGQRLLAHELTHIIQQSGIGSVGGHQLIQRDMVRDRNEEFYFSTRSQAEQRFNNMIRLVPAPGTDSKFLIEWRWDPTNPSEDPWQRGTISRSHEEAEARRDLLMRVVEDDGQWFVEKDTALAPQASSEISPPSSSEEQNPGTSSSGINAEARSGAGNRRVFSLTFDDGPHTAPLNTGHNRTEKVLNTLRDKSAKGGFFIQTHAPFRGNNPVGRQLIRRMNTEGHAIGIHTGGTTDHELHTDSQAAGRLQPELEAARSFIRDTTATNDQEGVEATLVRPPTGLSDADVIQTYQNIGLTNLLWDIDGDRQGISSLPDLKTQVETGIRSLANNNWQASTPLAPKIIILYHDIRRNTSDNIGPVIDHIRDVTRDVDGSNAVFERP